MNTPTTSRSISSVTIAVLIVCVVCSYALFMKAYEVDNWRGFWFSFAHVAIVALGVWLSLRKAR